MCFTRDKNVDIVKSDINFKQKTQWKNIKHSRIENERKNILNCQTN